MNILLSMMMICSFMGPYGAKNDYEYKDAKFEQIKNIARELAQKPYTDHRKKLPMWLRVMNYDDMRNIRFIHERAIWRQERLPFQIHFFHPGCIQNDQITIHLVDGDKDEILPFDQSMFRYDHGLESETLDQNIKFSGFRIHYPLNRPDYLDELIVFQGATYYRALAKNLNYGISARTISINTATDQPEEFPLFRDFWIFRPDRSDTSITVMGIFDGPSLSGAAEFIITPDIVTYVDVKVTLFSRDKEVKNYGISPLTSMFWFGSNSQYKWGDFRPEVHDSDGLLIHESPSKWIWRPLTNDGRLKKSYFECAAIKGFGLIQRNRNFLDYKDLETKYDNRPSVWVEPIGEWTDGYVELIEIPSHTEYNDNIVVFWQSRTPILPNSSIEYKYRQTWFSDEKILTTPGRVMATYLSNPPPNSPPRTKRFIVEFTWADVENDANSGKLETFVNATNATIANKTGIYNPYDKRWRIFFDVTANDNDQPVEMDAWVSKDNKTLTEHWTYQWYP